MITFELNKEGHYLARIRKLTQEELPNGLILADNMIGFTDIIQVCKNGTASIFDLSYLVNSLEIDFMEFKRELCQWLLDNDLNDNEWHRFHLYKIDDEQINSDNKSNSVKELSKQMYIEWIKNTGSNLDYEEKEKAIKYAKKTYKIIRKEFEKYI